MKITCCGSASAQGREKIIRGEYLQGVGCENQAHIHAEALTEMGCCQRAFSAILSTAGVFSSVSGKESLEIFTINWTRAAYGANLLIDQMSYYIGLLRIFS